MMTQTLEPKTPQPAPKQSTCAQSPSNQEQLDLSDAAVLAGIKHYYAGLIAPEDLERSVTIDEVEVKNNQVLISFHGWLGANKQRIRLSIDEYRRATSNDNEQEEVNSYLQEQEAFLKPLSRMEVKFDLFLKQPGDLAYSRIASISRDILGRWYALDSQGLTIADNSTSKLQVVSRAITHHLESIHREQQLAEMIAPAVMRFAAS